MTRHGRWRQDGLEHASLHARDVHPRIVDQRRFVDTDVRSIVEAHREWRLGSADPADRSAVVEIFLAVGFERWRQPGGTWLEHVELG